MFTLYCHLSAIFTLYTVIEGVRLRQARAQALEHVQDVLRPRAALHAAQPVRELLHLSRTVPLRNLFTLYVYIYIVISG